MSNSSSSSLLQRPSWWTRRPLRVLGRAARQGMSLVEIMVVITIIALVTSVIAVNVFGYLDRAKVETTRLQMDKIEQALLTYSMSHRGKFPSGSEGLKAAAEYFPDNEVPVDAWGGNFVYTSPGTKGKYDITSLGADGKDGGEGVDADIHSWDK